MKTIKQANYRYLYRDKNKDYVLMNMETKDLEVFIVSKTNEGVKYKNKILSFSYHLDKEAFKHGEGYKLPTGEIIDEDGAYLYTPPLEKVSIIPVMVHKCMYCGDSVERVRKESYGFVCFSCKVSKNKIFNVVDEGLSIREKKALGFMAYAKIKLNSGKKLTKVEQKRYEKYNK